MGDGFVTSLENTFRTHSHGDFSLHPILGQHPIYNPHSLSEAPSLCLNLFRSLILCFVLFDSLPYPDTSAPSWEKICCAYYAVTQTNKAMFLHFNAPGQKKKIFNIKLSLT